MIGEEVDLGDGPLRKRYRVVSVERRLPPHGAEAAQEPSEA
jgi:hypothetical protein